MSFIKFATLSAFLPGAALAAGHHHVRGQNTHHDNTVHRRTRNFGGGGGFMKMDYLKDWRDRTTTKKPSPTRAPTRRPTEPPTFPPTRRPTAPPTFPPTFRPTPSPTRSPDTGTPDCQEVEDSLERSLQQIVDQEEIDLVPGGSAPGDFFLFGGNDLLDFAGNLVGQVSGRCVVLQPPEIDPEGQYCTMDINFLDGSSLVLQGVAFELFVVAGTGCFEEAEGVFVRGFDTFDFIPLNEYADPADCFDVEESTASPWVEARGNLDWNYVDWNENGLSAGDIYTFHSQEFITDLGGIGVLEGECMILVDLATEKRFCTMTFLTEDFTSLVQAQGIFDNMVITGGTGCFDGATGAIMGSRRPEGGFQYDLLLGDQDSSGDGSCTPGLFDETWIEPFGNDELVQYTDQLEFGVMYAFDNKIITTPSRGDIGVLSGRCTLLNNSVSTYCNIVFELDNEGTIAVQGFYREEMTVVGGSGCFQGLKGTVTATEESDSYYEYTWSIVP